MAKRMTVTEALSSLAKMDSQIVCPRPTPFGGIMNVICELADAAEPVIRNPEFFGDWRELMRPQEGDPK